VHRNTRSYILLYTPPFDCFIYSSKILTRLGHRRAVTNNLANFIRKEFEPSAQKKKEPLFANTSNQLLLALC
jgi:hypothetical protein